MGREMLALDMAEIEKRAVRTWGRFAARVGAVVVLAEQARAHLRDQRDAVSVVAPSLRDAILEALRVSDERALAAESDAAELRARVAEQDQEISMLYKALEWKQARDRQNAA